MDGILEGLMNSPDSKEKSITHTMISGGAMHIPKDKLDAVYKKIVKYGLEGNQTIQLVEKMGPIHPFIVDIDIKYDSDIQERQYTQETIVQTLTFLWGKLSDYLDLDDRHQFGEMWVMEKDKPYPCITNKEFVSKDGIHIVFPNIILKRDVYKGIMSLLQEGQIIVSIFEETCEVTPANKKDTLMD